MMRRKIIYFMVVIVSLLTVCCSDSDDANDEFLGDKDFIFNVTIDSATLTQEDSFNILFSRSFITPREETYAIESNADLDAFNQTLTADEQLSITDLDTTPTFS